MIPRAVLTAWRASAPWILDTQVEQDLIVARAIIELFQDPELARLVAFRGGTALHKLFLDRPLRYSEDIDLVQMKAGPIGPVLDGIHRRLDPWLGRPQWKRGRGLVTLYYRFESETEPVAPMRLKVEVNTREHFSVFGPIERRFSVGSPWFDGAAELTTYSLDELLGTKLRALYQRKKGRDLFDLWALCLTGLVDPERVVACFRGYLEHEGRAVSRAEFEANLKQKMDDPDFVADVGPLISPGVEWDCGVAASFVLHQIVARLSGEPWKGMASTERDGRRAG
ncbi:MAG: nucleotidyl transferase AbiEii/AbiGii toxin family protein [Deltaproteobacteria bacterium]|nr:nucleotidyl transferase AbiEii/AbiGii toxin family protein [Deltaproteobacteria bacterium]